MKKDLDYLLDHDHDARFRIQLVASAVVAISGGMVQACFGVSLAAALGVGLIAGIAAYAVAVWRYCRKSPR